MLLRSALLGCRTAYFQQSLIAMIGGARNVTEEKQKQIGQHFSEIEETLQKHPLQFSLQIITDDPEINDSKYICFSTHTTPLPSC
jgi:hypothetical protein